ncbi:MAG: hypothetical protein ACLQPD_19780 [Desulfomonilaceae bacterium]
MKDARCETCVQLFIKQREFQREYEHEYAQNEPQRQDGHEPNEERERSFAASLHTGEKDLYNHLKDCRGDEWENGKDLMERLNCSESSRCETVLPGLPMYVFTEGGDFKLLSEARKEWPLYTSLRWGRLAAGFIKPKSIESVLIEKKINWWFRRKEVAFFERLRPDICGVTLEDISLWITREQLAHIWEITSDRPLILVRDKGLPAWSLDKNTGLSLVSSEYIQAHGLKDALFDKLEVDNFRNQYRKFYNDLLSTRNWLSPQGLLERWENKKNLAWLESEVKKMMLPIYSLSQDEQPQPLSEKVLARKGGGFLAGEVLDEYLFKLSDVQEFEEKLLEAYEKGKLCPVKETLGMTRMQLASRLWHDLAYTWTDDEGKLPEHEVLKRIREHKWGQYSTRDQTVRDALHDIPDTLIIRKAGRPAKTAQ